MHYYRNLFYSGKYSLIIEEIEKIINDKTCGITDELLNVYIESLIKLGKFDEAIMNIEFVRKYYPGQKLYKGVNLLFRYAKCKRCDLINELLSTIKISSKDLFKLANILYYNDEIMYAYSLYKKMNDECVFEEKSIEYQIIKSNIKSIDNFNLFYSLDNSLISKQTYACYKYNGRVLEPGVVVFLWNEEKIKDVSNNDKDVKKYIKPYMIWKIIGKDIFAFPLTTKLNKSQFTFFSQNYAFQHPDRRMKDTLTCLKEYQISNIDGKINQSDFIDAIDMMYTFIKYNQDNSETGLNRFFIETIENERIESSKKRIKENNLLIK